jgi:hypothetical protein
MAAGPLSVADTPTRARAADGRYISWKEHIIDDEATGGVAIAGSDGQYRWAQVTLQGKQLVLSHADIKAPVQVRYAWADNPDAVLYNQAGLPASPFVYPAE